MAKMCAYSGRFGSHTFNWLSTLLPCSTENQVNVQGAVLENPGNELLFVE